ncbi:hypothetical protein CUMW_102690 [Citrus unshiu]|nr:hypothetical protein CUMW_102690 [Citrus unshiu]
MEPTSSIFRLAALVWAVIFTCDNVAVRTGTIVTASALSPIQLEKKALINTGWWNCTWTTADYSSDHCTWELGRHHLQFSRKHNRATLVLERTYRYNPFRDWKFEESHQS